MMIRFKFNFNSIVERWLQMSFSLLVRLKLLVWRYDHRRQSQFALFREPRWVMIGSGSCRQRETKKKLPTLFWAFYHMYCSHSGDLGLRCQSPSLLPSWSTRTRTQLLTDQQLWQWVANARLLSRGGREGVNWSLMPYRLIWSHSLYK